MGEGVPLRTPDPCGDTEVRFNPGNGKLPGTRRGVDWWRRLGGKTDPAEGWLALRNKMPTIGVPYREGGSGQNEYVAENCGVLPVTAGGA